MATKPTCECDEAELYFANHISPGEFLEMPEPVRCHLDGCERCQDTLTELIFIVGQLARCGRLADNRCSDSSATVSEDDDIRRARQPILTTAIMMDSSRRPMPDRFNSPAPQVPAVIPPTVLVGTSPNGLKESPRRRRRRVLIGAGTMACIAAAVLIMKGLPSQPPDLPRHAILAEQAGKAFDAGNYEEVIRLSQECLDGFEPAAVRMQKELEGVGGDLPKGIVNSSVRKKLLSHGPLNDAAACSFYMGQAYRKLRRFDEAQAAYKKAAMFTYARVWDPAAANPFFWSPADDAAYWLQKLSDSR